MRPIRVLVTDDSAMFRRVLTDIISAEPDLEVAGTARDGLDCLEKVAELNPDIITLDVEMPRLNGLETIPRLRAQAPSIPIVMFSSLTEAGAVATIEALSKGAADYVAKPSAIAGSTQGIQAIREDLVPKIRALVGQGAAPRPAAGSAVARPQLPARGALVRATAPPARNLPPSVTNPLPRVERPAGVNAASPRSRGRVEVLAIGSSTGGPNALAAVLPALPKDLPVPVVVTQHMPAVFTRLLAERLDATCGLSVKEAEDGEDLRVGCIYIAPGDFHMTVAKSGPRTTVRLDQGPKENYCRPAVDPLFRSVVTTFGGGVVAAVLTGMGHDGKAGAEAIRAAGGYVIAQDKATSVVWGMPGAVAQANLANEVLPIQDIAGVLVRRCTGRPAVTTPTRDQA